jgi:hypothetical protein
MASILLAFLDNVRGNMWRAHKHILGAAAIVKEHRDQTDTAQGQSLLISRILAPVVEELSGVLGSIYGPSTTLLLGPATGKPFLTFIDAHDEFYTTTEQLSLQLRTSSKSFPDYTLLDRLEFWREKFLLFLDGSNGVTCDCPWPECLAHHRLGALFLEIIFRLARARLHSAISGLNNTYDLYEEDLSLVVDACEQMIHIFNSSPASLSESARTCLGFRPIYFPSLWLVAETCRDPFLCRRAASIFRLRRESNGCWDNFCVADFAEWFTALEEVGSPNRPVTCSADVPESARVVFLHASGFKIQPTTGSVSLRSNYAECDVIKFVVIRKAQDTALNADTPDVTLDAHWAWRAPSGKYVPISASDIPAPASTGWPQAIGGLFPQASTASTPKAAATRLWSMLDETRTALDHWNDWRWRLAHPPYERVPRATDGTLSCGAEGKCMSGQVGDEGLEERAMCLQVRTIHAG